MIVASGQKQTLYSEKNGKSKEIGYPNPKEILYRVINTNDPKDSLDLGYSWDCSIGLFIFGTHAEILKVYDVVKEEMESVLDFEPDFSITGGDSIEIPNSMSLYQEDDFEYAFIILEGQCDDRFSDKFMKKISKLKTPLIEIGASINDNDPFISIMEKLTNEFTGQFKYFRKDIAKSIAKYILASYQKKSDEYKNSSENQDWNMAQMSLDHFYSSDSWVKILKK